jgi:excisionase family DNA binding protein
MVIKHSSPLTAEQLSKILNVSELTIKKLARAKELPCVYINRRPRFHLEKLLGFFRRLEGGAA